MTTLTISRLSRHIFHEKTLVNHCNAFVSLKNLSSSIFSGDNNEGTNNILVKSKLQNSSRMSKTPKVKAGLPGRTGVPGYNEKLVSSEHAPKSDKLLNGSINAATCKNPKRKHQRKKKKAKKSEDVGVDPVTDSMAKLNISSKNSKRSQRFLRKATTRAHFSRSMSSNAISSDPFEEMSKYILSGQSKNIVVMAGAGISTASGIPDFRTPGTGLYDNLQRYNIPYPTAVFNIDFFHKNPRPFFELAKELYPSGKYRPNKAHYFVRLLHEKGLLLRMYTQNIDGLERLAGIPPRKLVEAHGTFATASCTMCGKKYEGASIKDKIFSGGIPRCHLTELCTGVVKPDIVFFGEDLPKRFYYYLRDFPVCDTLIVMGTSLEVEPFASLVESVRYNAPRFLLNRDLVGPFERNVRSRPHDCASTGELSDSIERFVSKLGWKHEFQKLIEANENPFAESKEHRTTCCDEEGTISTTPTDSGVSSASSVASNSSHSKGLPPPVDTNVKRFFHSIRSTPLSNMRTVKCENEDSNNIASMSSTVSYFDFLRKSVKPQSTSLKPPQQRPRPAAGDKRKELVSIYSLSKNCANAAAAPPIQYVQTVSKQQHSRKFSAKSLPALRHRGTDSQCSLSSESSDSETSESSGDS